MKLKCAAAILTLPFIATTSWAEEPLFKASFETQLDADVAKGGSAPEDGTAEITTEKGGKEGEAILVKGGPNYKTLTYRADGNINLDTGCVEFWYQPDFSRKQDSTSIYYLFDLPTPIKGADENLIRVVIAISDDGANRVLNVFPGSVAIPPSISSPISWEPGEWHHIAVTWDANEVVLYVDGRNNGSMKTKGGLFDGSAELKTSGLENFAIGGLINVDGSQSADGKIDDVKIWPTAHYTGEFPL